MAMGAFVPAAVKPPHLVRKILRCTSRFFIAGSMPPLNRLKRTGWRVSSIFTTDELQSQEVIGAKTLSPTSDDVSKI